MRLGALLAGLFLDVVAPGGCRCLQSARRAAPAVTLARLDRAVARPRPCSNRIPGVLGGTIAALGSWPAQEGAGAVLLLGILVFADSFAFFVGHALGRRRLAPRVSPGKSVEGALGGLVGGVVGAFAVRQLGLPDLAPLQTAGLGVAVAAMGIVGDLDESLLKRWAGVKDSGTLFPGHGGMLDRIDSLLFGAPVLYYYFLYVR
jgi:CDP-diglyceride synthetase